MRTAREGWEMGVSDEGSNGGGRAKKGEEKTPLVHGYNSKEAKHG